MTERAKTCSTKCPYGVSNDPWWITKKAMATIIIMIAKASHKTVEKGAATFFKMKKQGLVVCTYICNLV